MRKSVSKATAAGVLIGSSLLISCTSGQGKTESGVYRPKLGTSRHTYVKNFPVGVATKQEVLDGVGSPDKVYSSDGIEYLTYIIRNDSGGKIEYTYYIQDGKVIDVKMVNNWIFGNEIHQHSKM